MELEILREKVRRAKEIKDISFSYFAKEIGIKRQSFYNFMTGTKGLSEEKQKRLENLLEKFI